MVTLKVDVPPDTMDIGEKRLFNLGRKRKRSYRSSIDE